MTTRAPASSALTLLEEITAKPIPHGGVIDLTPACAAERAVRKIEPAS